MFRLGETARFVGAFYDVNGDDYVPSDASIVLKPSYAPELSMAAVSAGGNLYYADVLLSGFAGMWMYRFETTDVGAAPNTWASILISSPDDSPTLNEIHNSLQQGGVNTITPVVDGANIELVQGDDYYLEDGRAIVWDVADYPTDLSGAVLMFVLKTEPLLYKLVTLVGNEIVLELSSTETTLAPTRYNYYVQATLDNSHIVTVAKGRLLIIQPDSDGRC